MCLAATLGTKFGAVLPPIRERAMQKGASKLQWQRQAAQRSAHRSVFGIRFNLTSKLLNQLTNGNLFLFELHSIDFASIVKGTLESSCAK